MLGWFHQWEVSLIMSAVSALKLTLIVQSYPGPSQSVMGTTMPLGWNTQSFTVSPSMRSGLVKLIVPKLDAVVRVLRAICTAWSTPCKQAAEAEQAGSEAFGSVRSDGGRSLASRRISIALGQLHFLLSLPVWFFCMELLDLRRLHVGAEIAGVAEKPLLVKVTILVGTLIGHGFEPRFLGEIGQLCHRPARHLYLLESGD